MKRLFATGCLTALALTASAQEFGIELNGGLQGLRYKYSGASPGIQSGGSLGVNYLFPFGSRWGILTGIGAGYYNTKTTLNNGATRSSYEVDDMGSAFQYNIKATGYKETNSFLSAAIPVMLQYQTCGKTQWYVNGGAKILIPFSVKTKASAQQLDLSGYYPDYNIEVKDMPQHGFGVLSNWSHEAKPELRPTTTLSAATGFSFPACNNLRLYTGVYFDYGLTDPRKESDANASLVAYNAGNINQAGVNGLMNKGDDARILAYGIQVRIGFSKKKKAVQPVAMAEPIVAPVETKPAPVVEPANPTEVVQVFEPVIDSAVVETMHTITESEQMVVNQPVTFVVLGKTNVPEGLKPHLDSVAGILKQYPGLHVLIVGHTCDIGTERENAKVGLERAESVAAYLKKKGVPASRISTNSAGPSQPIVPNDSSRNRSENRRVTITVK
ncbi:MAG: OmpA family protein [Pseudobacter sp.]|uniref:OmpA family protein n=1 Tax=Pseudobacter sp. TaxID=2045420 RepID=UPI003F820B4E